MFKKMLVVFSGCVLAVVSASAQGPWDEADLGIDLDATVTSKYMWRGFDVLDDEGAFQPSINFDIFDSGFTHATVGVSTSFEYKDFALTPAVNYQWTFDEDDPGSVNDENEFWASISLSYSFTTF